MDVPVQGLEAKTHIGWECPKCRTVHAPFITSCSTCTADNYPRIPQHLLNDLRDRIKANPNFTDFVLKRATLEKLIVGCSPRAALLSSSYQKDQEA